MKHERKGLKDKLREIKSESFENSPVFPRIMMYSNREVIICGCGGITEYSEKEIRLDCNNVTLIFMGVDMIIDSYVTDEVRISGIITGMEFS